MAQKYKIFLNEKLLIIEQRTGNSKRRNIALISSQQELFAQLHDLEEGSAAETINIFSSIPLNDLFRQSFKIVKAAGGLVFNDSGQLLFIKRHGIWDLPKGKLHVNETYKSGGLREVSEETGLSGLRLLDKCGVTHHLYLQKDCYHLKNTIWYTMYHNGNETLTPQLEEDITDVQWFSLQEIPDIVKNTYRSLQELIINNISKR